MGLHVAIIMDGNGRWAKLRGLPRWRGHVAGVDSVRSVVRAARDLNVTALTMYAFSSDNWKRSATEVGRLFWLLREYCVKERKELLEEGVRVTAIGRRDRIPRSALKELEEIERVTAGNSRLNLRLAIDYSARWAISDAARRVAELVANGVLTPEELDAAALNAQISDGVPDPDLLIRTAGEKRVSDFLLWELAYTEFYFTPRYWPEFTGDDLAEAVAEFAGRERRFGGIGEGRRTA